MKFSFARGALALTAMLTLASCGGDKATFPITVTVFNVIYDGLVLSTNGQEVAVPKAADPSKPVTVTFPNEIEYGQAYDVVPKGLVLTSTGYTGGAYPKHQTCEVPGSSSYPYNLPPSGTAGQLAKIQVYYICSIVNIPLTGKVTGLRAKGLVLANGSTTNTVSVAPATDATTGAITGNDVALALTPVPYGSTYGVTIFTQPTGQTCTITGGASGNGSGTMDDAAEKAGGVTNLLVSCVNNPA